MDGGWMDKLSGLRREIDEIDSEIINLLNRRFDIVREISEIKIRNNVKIIDRIREREILERAGTYREIFRKILVKSVETQWETFTDIYMERRRPGDGAIGVVGYGKMGRLFTRLFKKYYKVNIYDIKRVQPPPDNNIGWSESLRELVHTSKYIMIAASLNSVDKVAAEIREIIENDALGERIVFDIATIKHKVIRELYKYPPHIKVSSIHPMFGGNMRRPWNHKILIIPLRDRVGDAKYVEELFRPFGFRTIYVSPDEHDEYIGYTIVLPYLLGLMFIQAIDEIGDERLCEFGGTSYKFFTNYTKNIIKGDTKQFIYELLVNQQSKKLMSKLIGILRSIYEDPHNILSQHF